MIYAVCRSGETLASSPTEGAGHAGAIRYLAIDAPYEHIITVGDDKKLIVWRLSDLVLLSERYVRRTEWLKFCKESDSWLLHH